MKLRGVLFVSFLAVTATVTSVRAEVSDRTAEIFNKGKRELEPPPKSLKANSEDSDLRYREGTERLSRKISSEGTASASTVPVDDPLGNEYPPPPSRGGGGYLDNNHAAAITGKRKRAGFNGERFFGLGFVGGGSYGVFGTEVDFGVADDWTAGFGIGTGMAYNTWALHTRYYLKQGRWSPLIEAGFAEWSLGKAPLDQASVTPSYLSERFFEDKAGGVTGPRSAHLIYPGLGLLYQHRSGLAALFELQYLINATDFSGALYGSVGAYFYF